MLEPVFLLGPSRVAGTSDDVQFAVRGTAADGALLFRVPVEPGEVIDLGGVAERHFALRMPIDEESARRLHRVEVLDRGRTLAERTATSTAAGFAGQIAAAGIVTADRMSESQVRLQWDADRSPMVIVMVPETGQILAFGRGGEVVVATTEPALEVALSDGVQSGVRVVQVK